MIKASKPQEKLNLFDLERSAERHCSILDTADCSLLGPAADQRLSGIVSAVIKEKMFTSKNFFMGSFGITMLFAFKKKLHSQQSLNMLFISKLCEGCWSISAVLSWTSVLLKQLQEGRN